MTLTELRYLVALAEHRHFGRAADSCHVSQPTLSTQLRKLEEQLGVTLFERGRQVTPTAIGASIIAEARQVLAGAGRLRDLASAARTPLTGPFRLGVIPTLCPYLLPWLLGPLHQAYPALDLSLTEDVTDILVARLVDHELDAALLALPVDQPDCAALPLFDEPFLLACPPDHPLAGSDTVDPGTLRDAGLMLLNEGHCLRDQAIALCGETRLDPRFQTASLTTLRHLVAAGHGCTLLPGLAAAMEADPKVRLVALSSDSAVRRIALLHRRSSPRSADFTALADLIRAAIPSERVDVIGA